MNYKNKLKIGLVDDHNLLRDSISIQIDNLPNCEVILNAYNGLSMIREIEKGKIPDLMIVDLSMPGMDGFETTKWIFKHFPTMHVMIFSMHESDFNVIRLLKMGVKSFLSKEAELDEISKAINSIIAYGSYFPPTVTRNLITLFHNPENESFTHPLMISENEIKFLNLACTELTYIEIAEKMFVSPRTVENYRNKLTEKWDVKTRTGLVVYALKNGIILP